jgi:7,8-dihydropterin-6-yl-methyl-4-(beta-D-ribofuranosyl)aminobenzene 5'-phosphate synthase
MKIITLIEDNKCDNNLISEHGLSLYIEYKNKKIILDTGASDNFLKNAINLNINIKNIDYVVITHAHFDHCGGLLSFLKANNKAKIYIKKNEQFETYYKNNKTIDFIGLDIESFSQYYYRFVFIKEDIIQIDDYSYIISKIDMITNITYNNSCLKIKKNNLLLNDDFEHELIFVIKENRKTSIFSGCAHKGIINMIHTVKSIFKIKKINNIIGGLHLIENPIIQNPVKTETLDEISNYLKDNVINIYTCHCTGLDAFNYLKKDLKNHINYISTGSIINL